MKKQRGQIWYDVSNAQMKYGELKTLNEMAKSGKTSVISTNGLPLHFAVWT